MIEFTVFIHNYMMQPFKPWDNHSVKQYATL